MNIAPKTLCEAGFAVSMAQARRMIALGAVQSICKKCGCCRCDECQTKHPTCHVCGSRETTVHVKGSKI